MSCNMHVLMLCYCTIYCCFGVGICISINLQPFAYQLRSADSKGDPAGRQGGSPKVGPVAGPARTVGSMQRPVECFRIPLSG